MTSSADGALRLLHDRTLADRARHGDRGAFRELQRRHSAASWRLALVVTRSTAAASAAVAAAFASVLTQPDRAMVDAGASLRPQLLAATRLAALTEPREAGRLDPLAIDPGVPVAFHRLPELWRSVLWLTDVEELPHDEVTTILELTPEGLESLLGRAQAGVTEQLTQEQVAGLDTDCREATELLGPYAAEELSPRQAARVRRHLDGCAACCDRLEEVDDLHPGLRRSMVAVPLLLLADTEAAWLAALAPETGPLHLVLPGGRTVPAWAERALAGAAAVVVAVGITGAVMSGRGKGREDLVRETSTEQAFGTPDGESAFGGTPGRPPADEPAGGDPDDAPEPGSTGGTAGGESGTGAGSSTGSGGTTGGETPRATPPGGTPSAPPSTPTSPPSTPPPGGNPGPSTPTTPSGPAPGPVLDVTVGVEGTLGLSLGDECTDLTVLGTSLSGCGGDEAPGIEVGGSLLPPIRLGL
jgi:DNA-directed RNA polymerase specialized sigma24 family protein